MPAVPAAEALRPLAGGSGHRPFVLAEGWTTYRDPGRLARAIALLAEVGRGAYPLESFSDAGDVAMAHEIIEAFADLVCLADASSSCWWSRRYQALDALTLDERHFRTLRKRPRGRPGSAQPFSADASTRGPPGEPPTRLCRSVVWTVRGTPAPRPSAHTRAAESGRLASER